MTTANANSGRAPIDARRVIRTIPRLSIHEEMRPREENASLLMICTPFYSMGNLNEEAMHLPSNMKWGEKVEALEDQAREMMAIWKREIYRASTMDDSFCIFIRPEEKLGYASAKAVMKEGVMELAIVRAGEITNELLSFTQECFEGWALYVGSLEQQVMMLGKANPQNRIPEEVNVFVMGEYSSRWLPRFATMFAKSSGIPYENVFVVRELSVDIGEVKDAEAGERSLVFGDPESPAVIKRKALGFSEATVDEKLERSAFERRFLKSVERAEEDFRVFDKYR